MGYRNYRLVSFTVTEVFKVAFDTKFDRFNCFRKQPTQLRNANFLPVSLVSVRSQTVIVGLPQCATRGTLCTTSIGSSRACSELSEILCKLS